MIVECDGRIMTLEEAEGLEKPTYELSDEWYNSILNQSYQLVQSGNFESCELKAKNNGKRIL